MQQKHRSRTFKIVAAAGATAIAAAIGIAAQPANAAGVDHPVATSGDTFGAITGTVAVGDTITFSGLDGHNATSNGASPATFASPAGAATYVFTAVTPGAYTYDCTFHDGMTGSFTVGAAGAAPAPAAGATAPAADAPAADAPAADAPAADAPAADAPAADAPAADAPAADAQAGEAPVAGAPAAPVDPAAPAAPAGAGVDHPVATSGDTFGAITGTVAVGDTITFSGLDGHNATSNGASPATFASPAGAATYVFTAVTPGAYTYDCTFHDGMTGSFTVGAAGAAPAAGAPAAPAAGAPAAPVDPAAAPADPAAAPAGGSGESGGGGDDGDDNDDDDDDDDDDDSGHGGGDDDGDDD